MADIILKDRDGRDLTYEGVNAVKLLTKEGEMQTFIAGETQETTVELDFSQGDMTVLPEEGKFFSKVQIPKPVGLTEKNIAEGIDIAGIIGTLTGDGGGEMSKALVKIVTGGSTDTITLATAEELATINFDTSNKCFALLISLNMLVYGSTKNTKCHAISHNWKAQTDAYGYESYNNSSGYIRGTNTVNTFTTANGYTPYYADGEMRIDYNSSHAMGAWNYLFVVGCYSESE